jgi:hexosaminidase
MIIRKILICCLFTGHLAAQERPALIPLPTSLIWGNGKLLLSDRLILKVSDSTLAEEADFFKEAINDKVKNPSFTTRKENIVFSLSLNKELSSEAYHLTVTSNRISLVGGSDHGVFNGIQTMLQLIQHDFSIPFVEIKDSPAFSVRGYMIDVGRNFQSLPLIKEQIDMMAKLKMNVFHFHLTEDIAWRIESKLYPALHDSANMMRNKGRYYRFDEIRDLVEYCRQRHIELIPEIDMPGHSAAFTRAVGHDMQSPEGKKILGQLLNEFLDEVNVCSIHIGGDEVRYKDTSFLKDMSQLLLSRGKKILAWDPGGKTLPGTIHQLWQGNVQPPLSQPSIDSRHLYLNHLDPLEGVPSTFNHRVLNVDKGDSLRLGAILCNWPDRKVADERDAIIMNPVLPVMMAFAERTWRGGGYYNYGADFGKPGDIRYQAFQNFEDRMIRLHDQTFVKNEFPYVAQSNVSWSLVGPFENEGDLNRSFAPEQKNFFDTAQLNTWNKVYGATIWLRHFWHPMINSHIRDPKDSTTWYAYREIYSDFDRDAYFWIGFKNISRSVQASTPPAGQWDERQSKVWVNGEMISAPVWKFPGRIPKSLEEPLVDESYEYRQSTRIRLKKGLNKVLIKAPAGNFKGPWYDPVKWMFSFIEVKD